ncbi:hypothetical protein, partial [Acinetobacter baumannii]
YPSYALNLAQLGALCISNLCATKPYFFIMYSSAKVISKNSTQRIKILKSGIKKSALHDLFG